MAEAGETEARTPGRFQVLGREVELPCVVRDASAAVATWLVPAAAAATWLPAELELVELLPGRGLLSIGAIDYRDNDLGDYDEVQISLFVRERGAPRGIPWLSAGLDFARGRLPTWIAHLPVNQAFTCEAGRAIWGFPKTEDTIVFEPQGKRVRCRWEADGQLVLALDLPRGGRGTLPERAMQVYTVKEGTLHRTRFASAADEVGARLGGARLDLGPHPVAAELRALGLPKRALASVWMGRMRARFEAPEKR